MLNETKTIKIKTWNINLKCFMNYKKYFMRILLEKLNVMYYNKYQRSKSNLFVV